VRALALEEGVGDAGAMPTAFRVRSKCGHRPSREPNFDLSLFAVLGREGLHRGEGEGAARALTPLVWRTTMVAARRGVLRRRAKRSAATALAASRKEKQIKLNNTLPRASAWFETSQVERLTVIYVLPNLTDRDRFNNN
jgi:hypothetical protein